MNFEGAKFPDLYLLRNGQKAVFLKENSWGAMFIYQPKGATYAELQTDKSGFYLEEGIHSLDVVCKYSTEAEEKVITEYKSICSTNK